VKGFPRPAELSAQRRATSKYHENMGRRVSAKQEAESDLFESALGEPASEDPPRDGPRGRGKSDLLCSH
jgi:hypothetical protein